MGHEREEGTVRGLLTEGALNARAEPLWQAEPAKIAGETRESPLDEEPCAEAAEREGRALGSAGLATLDETAQVDGSVLAAALQLPPDLASFCLATRAAVLVLSFDQFPRH